jgi:hypothetical protein
MTIRRAHPCYFMALMGATVYWLKQNMRAIMEIKSILSVNIS